MNFTPAGPNGLVDCYLLVKSADKKTSSKGDCYLDLTLADKSGEINAKLWSYIPAVHGEYQSGNIVKLRGTVSQYNGNPQLRIEKIRLAFPEDGVEPSDFVQSSEFSGEKMFDELKKIAEGFKDNGLRAITVALLDENKSSLLTWPAAFKLHHAILGGLLMHTLSIVRLCESVAELYPFIDRELLIAGAMLHDIAKTREYEVSDSGLATGYSVKGNLIGHLAEGAIMIRQTALRLGVSEDISNLLEHMLLSHHGEPEYGAAVRPMFIEAELLSELDMLDARLYEMKEATFDTAKGQFSGKMWSMDNRKLYNHGRENTEKTVKLF